MAEQLILNASQDYTELNEYFIQLGVKKILLVCDGSMQFLRLNNYFSELPEKLSIEVVRFSDFQPNPLYESAVKGVKVFHESHCDMIAAVGGGSAIDVAKCIKLYANMNSDENYLKQEIVPNQIPLIAVPTTAGTGSEATRFAVIYANGEKQSVAHESCIPSAVLLDPSVLKTLPLYQKKATLMDALCHAVESFWSVNSTEQSMQYSRQAIQIILENLSEYLNNQENANQNLLKAANIAGKAINITQTTAGHAMCYKLTSLYGIAHGHAAALCVKALFPYMLRQDATCIDTRGSEHLHKVFNSIASAMGCNTPLEASKRFAQIVDSLELKAPASVTEEQISILKHSVNPVRLKNHPISLDETIIEQLYREILDI